MPPHNTAATYPPHPVCALCGQILPRTRIGAQTAP